MTHQPECSIDSYDAAEPLYGTLKPANVWLLLEYDHPFGKKALAESDIPDAVKTYLESLPDTRTLLIRQPRHQHSGTMTCFVAAVNQPQPKLYAVTLTDYTELLDLDIAAVAAGDVIEPQDDPLYIVCTNGKRDNCCARYGMPVYTALTHIAGDAVWQSSHFGGHRFAATMLCFPHALCYGRVTPDAAATVITSYAAGQMLMPHYRGRGSHPIPAQAAEYALRDALGDTALDHLPLLDVKGEDDQWMVCFGAGEGSLKVSVTQSTSTTTVRQSCAKDVVTPMMHFACSIHSEG